MSRFTSARLAIPLCAALACAAAPASAAPILGSDLETFAILGASAVTIAGTGSVINGNLGSYPTDTVTGTNPTSYTISNGILQTTPGTSAFRLSAHNQLVAARVALGNTAPTGGASVLDGLTLLPGVYSGATMALNLNQTLTLDGGGNANALWIFNIGSTLTTGSSSVVNVINTGAGAGIYWNVGSSATLGSSSTFEGNILADQSITLGTTATIGCGRALAEIAAVSLDGTNTVEIGNCDSNGYSGGGTIEQVAGEFVVVASSPAPIPEPGTLVLFGLGLAGLGFARRKRAA